MFSLEPELAHLRDSGAIAEATAAPLIAVERREIVNLYGDLRFLTWAAVMVIVTGVGILVSKHLDRIGPVAVATAIGAAAAACYTWVVWKRKREPSLTDDYILLLGALLLSADVGFVEHTWHLLGAEWKHYFLILAAVHAATAYWFDSRLVLSVSLTSLAAWFGVRRDGVDLFSVPVETAIRAVICAAVIFAWRFVDTRLRKRRTFAAVFDHYATLLALWGLLLLSASSEMRVLAFLVTLAAAALCCAWGVRTKSEAFVIYGWLAALLDVNYLVDHFGYGAFQNSISLASVLLAIAGIALILNRMRKGRLA